MPQDYESLYIVKTDLSDEKIEQVIEAVSKLVEEEGGSIIELSLWGKKRLAYPMRKQKYGFYALLRFSAAKTVPEKLTRHFRFNENILKGIIVLFDGAAGRVPEVQKKEEVKELEHSDSIKKNNDTDKTDGID